MKHWEERNRRLDSFEDTLRRCERERQFIQSIKTARRHTVVWECPLEDIMIGDHRFSTMCDVKLARNTVLQEAKALRERFPSERIAILNYASGRHSGGSVIRGGDGIEESLCRCTTLYPCLDTQHLRETYYEQNRLCGDGLYRDICIYIPNIICFKEDIEEERVIREEEQFLVDLISCTLPDLSELFSHNIGISDERMGKERIAEVERTIQRRLEGMLAVAIHKKIDILVLGVLENACMESCIEDMSALIQKALQKYSYFFRAVHMILS